MILKLKLKLMLKGSKHRMMIVQFLDDIREIPEQ